MTRAELRWVVTWALVVMLVTCAPYLYVARLAPPGTSFSGLLFEADDQCVYLAWEQQAAQGHFGMRNLFTGEAQRGVYIHLLCWLIGSGARLTGAPLPLVHHAARMLLGILLLLISYRFVAVFNSDIGVRRTAFWFVALSSGFGWLVKTNLITERTPVDLWQPEAVTFSCLSGNGLFCAALSLILAIFLLLLAAEEKIGRERWSRVLGAGFLGLLLGNIHSYDVIIVGGVWAAYVAVRAVTERRFPGSGLADAVVACLVALPSILYQYYLYRTEPVFRMRADTPTLSAPFTSYLVGYGLVLLLAVAGAVSLVWTVRRAGQPLGQRLFPLTWGIVGFALPYLPFLFQRKLVMGLHLPLAYLAAVGAVALAQRVFPTEGVERSAFRVKSTGRDCQRSALHAQRSTLNAQGFGRAAIITGLLLLTLPSDWAAMRPDIRRAEAEASMGRLDPLNTGPFWPRADVEAVQWARRHLEKNGVILCAPGTGLLFPVLACQPVYLAHWAETPHVQERLNDTLSFYGDARASSQLRRAFLQARHIRYVYHGTAERELGAADLARDPLFWPIYDKNGVVIYELLQQPFSLSRAARPYTP